MNSQEKELIKSIGKMSLDDFLRSTEKIDSEDDKKEAIWARCATDLELFCYLFFPHYCTRPFNEFHYEYFRSVVFGERNVRRVRAAPRGSAKSTLATLIKPIHDVCYGLEKFILIISSTTPLSNKKLKDIRAEILSNDHLCAYYGLHFEKKNVGESEFKLHSDAGWTYFAAVGRGAEVRGIRINEYRPTKVILDDVEHSEEVYNEKSREKTENWFKEDIGKVGDTGTNVEFVGTVLHRDSLLSKTLRNPSYDSNLFKAIKSWSPRQDLWNEWTRLYTTLDNPNRVADSDAYFEKNKEAMLKETSVIWPEKETYLDHMKDLVEIGRRAFMKEKQNEPQGADEQIFERLHWFKEEPEGFRIEETGMLVKWSELYPVGAIDPATGRGSQNKNTDFNVILTGFKDRLGRLFVFDDWTKRTSPTKTIEAIFELNSRFKYEKFGIETNLYRDLMLENVKEYQRREEERTSRKMAITFYEIYQTENKQERIYRLEPKVNNAWILFNKNLSQEFKNQVLDFPNADHDDCPDCLEMLWSLVSKQMVSDIRLNLGR